ncbi:glycoside hydrolase family 28 protein [Neobacillus rhizophilus]|uniref:Fibronectin type III domain-containing protein n=1 Tax=Neobacillus rhizophilus TaxID=2833579 RepID=A0A942U5S4_9BACI|nr:glycoside hydrolase family 28 protein [Neobacillus rhizophilus]MBS4215245.1 fibronectin type III domain-containing protein [Neobacillus rhizophilus]
MKFGKKTYLTGALGLALGCSVIAPFGAFAATTPAKSNAQVSVDKQAPTAPINAYAYATTYKSVSLIWDRSTDNIGIAAYDVYVNGKLAGSSTPNEYGIAMSNFTVKDLKPNTMYSFKVVARDAAGNHSNESAHVNIKTDVLGKVFNVKDFGAKGDGETKDTAAIQAAIDAASASPNSVVILPAGTYYSAPLNLKSNMTFEIQKDATLLGSRDVSDYPVIQDRWEGTTFHSYQSLIASQGAKNLKVIGEGTVDGNAGPIKAMPSNGIDEFGFPYKKVTLDGKYDYNNGKYDPNAEGKETVYFNMGLWWDNPKATNPATQTARPRLVQFKDSENVLLQGLKITNSPSWTIQPLYSNNVVIDSVHVENPAVPVDAPNTDGVDPDSVDGLKIFGSTFNVGDDAIAIKSGKDAEGRQIGKPSQNIEIRNNIMKHGHGGVTIGSEMSGGVKNVVARDDIFDGTDIGIRMKTLRGRGGTIENLTFDNIMMKDIAGDVFNINSNYTSNGTPLPFTGVIDETTPYIKNITIKNITAEGAQEASFFQGLYESPVDGLTLENVTVHADKPLYFQYVKNITMKNVNINNGNMFQPNSIYQNLTVDGEKLPDTDWPVVPRTK